MIKTIILNTNYISCNSITKTNKKKKILPIIISKIVEYNNNKVEHNIMFYDNKNDNISYLFYIL